MNIIFSPIVTEKSVEDMKKGKYSFKVATYADKQMVKKEVEKNFNVNVIKVATINVKRRSKKTMQKRTVAIPAFKKAIVKVKDGQKIELFNIK